MESLTRKAISALPAEYQVNIDKAMEAGETVYLIPGGYDTHCMLRVGNKRYPVSFARLFGIKANRKVSLKMTETGWDVRFCDSNRTTHFAR